MLIGPLEIIKESWNLYVQNWRKFTTYLILLFFSTTLITLISAGVVYMDKLSIISPLYDGLMMLAIIIASGIFSLWVYISLLQVMRLCYEKKPVPYWKETLQKSSHLIWPAIIITIIVILIVIGGVILFIIPGIIFAVWYAFAYYEVVFENKTGMEALRASKLLIAGRWGGILWRLFVPGLAFGILIGLISNILNKITYYALSTLELHFLLVSSLVSSVVSIIFTPLTIGAVLLLYLSAVKNPVNHQAETPIKQ